MLGPKPIRPIHHYILPGLFVLSLFVALIIRSPEQNKQQNLRGEIMGTYWIVKTLHGDADLKEDIQKELDGINSYDIIHCLMVGLTRCSAVMKRKRLHGINSGG